MQALAQFVPPARIRLFFSFKENRAVTYFNLHISASPLKAVFDPEDFALFVKESGEALLRSVLERTDNIEKDMADFNALRVRWNAGEYSLMPEWVKSVPVVGLIEYANDLRAARPTSWNLTPYPMPENLLCHAE